MISVKPVFVGFFPKQTFRDVESMEIPGIKEVCAVSECISSGPEGWVEKWIHNDLGFFDLENQATSVIPQEATGYDIYAYEVFPFRCLSGISEPVKISSLDNPVPPDYEFLGYDIVTKSVADFFECSPLSCNYLGKEFHVNEHCLITGLQDAEEAYWKICDESIGEPGPYYLFGVYRKYA